MQEDEERETFVKEAGAKMAPVDTDSSDSSMASCIVSVCFARD